MTEASSERSVNTIASRATFAFAVAKQGNYDAARAAFNASHLTDQETGDLCRQLETALQDLAAHRLAEAEQKLSSVTDEIAKIGDDDTRIFFDALSAFMSGVRKLHEGDAHSAKDLLISAAKAFEGLDYVLGDLRVITLSATSAAFLSMARIATSIGDMSQAKLAWGKAFDCHDQLKKVAQAEGKYDDAAASEISGTNIESCIMLAGYELHQLSPSEAKFYCVKSNADRAILEESLPRIKDSPLKASLVALVHLHYALSELTEATEAMFVRGKRGPKIKQKILLAANHAREAAENAARGGASGVQAYHASNRLIQYITNLTKIESIASQEKINANGAVVGIFFLILTMLTYAFAQPHGLEWIPFNFLSLVVSVIVGFGVNSVKLAPLLRLVRPQKESGRSLN